MGRRRKNNKIPTWVIAVPWWGWLVLAFIAWGVGRLMLGFAPALTGTPAQILLNGLFKIAGSALMYAGPFFCVIWAVYSAAAGISRRASRTYAPHEEPTLGDVIDTPSDRHEPASDAPSIDTHSWNMRLLQALEWKRLEQLSAVYFRALKFRVEEAAPGPDGGVDLKLYGPDAKSASVFVQCKAWNSWKVGVKPIRELFGVMAAENVSEGIFVTTSSFTDEAAAFSRGKNIDLIDGSDLLKKLRDLPPDDQEQMLRLMTAGDFTTPTCPSCGIKMVSRTAPATGDSFWGCVRYPKCRTIITKRREHSNP